MCLQTAGATTASQSEGQNINAELKFAPQVLAANQRYSPAYTALNLSNMDLFLNGQNGTPGFLSEYMNQILPTQTAANTAIRTANLQDAANLTPTVIAGERAANPGAAGLLDTMTSNANRDLGYGTQLTPAEQVQFNQSARGGSAARGLGFGPSDVFNETLADTGFGQNLYQQRTGQAGNMSDQLQKFYGNPVGMISGMGNSSGIGAAQLASAGGTGAATSNMAEFNPANDMASQYAQNTFQGNLAEAGAYNSAFTSGAQSGMSAGGGMMSSL